MAVRRDGGVTSARRWAWAVAWPVGLAVACGGGVDGGGDEGGGGRVEDTGVVGPVDDTGGGGAAPVRGEWAIADTGGLGLSVDADGDGFSAREDCDDADPTVYPGAPEVCADGVVNDCEDDGTAAQETCAAWVFGEDDFWRWEFWGGIGEAIVVASAGDLDGDGLADVVFGLPRNPQVRRDGEFAWFSGFVLLQAGVTEPGGVYEPGDAPTVGSEETNDHVGNAVAALGDLDGDGYGDLAVGAPDSEGSSTDSPSAYRMWGPGAQGWMAADEVLVGPAPAVDCLGASVGRGPDADGDGYADVLVGAQCDGEVYLFSGSPEAVPPGGWVAGEDELARFYVPPEEVADGYDLGQYSRFGYRVLSADVDGDGVEDVVVSAPYPFWRVGDDMPSLGEVVVFHGPFAAGEERSVEDADQRVTGAAASTEQAGSMDNPMMSLGNGLSLSDLDGDGALDLVAGAPYCTVSGYEWFSGAVYGFYDLAGLGDADTEQADFVIEPVELEVLDHGYFGADVDATGDFDGDGVLDIAVGSGALYVEGTTVTSAVRRPGVGGWLFLGPLLEGTYASTDAEVYFPVPEDSNGMGWAAQVTFVGDVDGDGTDELMVADNGANIGLFSFSTRGWTGW